MDKREMYRSIIVNRSSRPMNFVKVAPIGYAKSNANVSTCQDNFDIYIKFDKKIRDIKFTGNGCSISTSALDMVAQYLIGKTVEDGISFIDNYRDMVKGKSFDVFKIKDLIALENVSVHLNRIGCALIGPNTIKVMLGGKDE